MTAAVLSSHYVGPQSSYSYMTQPQGPPSPPMDESSKVSLPSISNLLVMADQGSPTAQTFAQAQAQQAQAQQQQQSQQSSPQQQPQATQTKPATRPNSSHFNPLVRAQLPPTPPMTSEASFEGYNSPSTRSVSQLSTTSNYFYESTPPLGHVEPPERAHSHPPMATSVSRVPVQAPFAQPAYAAPQYMSQPISQSMSQPNPMAAYYPTMQPTPPPQPQISSLYYQRPLPQTFPPLPVNVSLAPSAHNPWQHHHYMAPSAANSFPQSQDRYICQTCNKAFSRPSSLRIHSHSHTGEKPFKCPHAGCGKAFSVRSNMKRHERGCHNYVDSSSSGSSLVSVS